MEKCQENDCERRVNGLTERLGTSRNFTGKPIRRLNSEKAILMFRMCSRSRRSCLVASAILAAQLCQ
jgi:hypothetical protein